MCGNGMQGVLYLAARWATDIAQLGATCASPAGGGMRGRRPTLHHVIPLLPGAVRSIPSACPLSPPLALG